MMQNAESDREILTMPDADVVFYRNYFSASESDTLFQELSTTIHWSQQSLKIAGGEVPFPRLTAWYGDADKRYRYSGNTISPEPWIPLLQRIKSKVEIAAEVEFNSVLINFYRNEFDSVSWHSDDEPELGQNPVIASLSFGAVRSFQFKHKQNTDLRLAIDLTPGSLLLMRGTTQHFWKHQVPKTKNPHGPRINLTFRIIVTPPQST